jgi:hypothetical protein
VRALIIGIFCAVGLVVGSRTPVVAAPTAGCQVAVALGTNLIANGDAEQQSGATTLTDVVPPSCWESAGNLTALAYTAPDNALPFPASGSGGGATYFAGGPAPTGQSTALLTQTVDLRPLQAAIEQGNIRATQAGSVATTPSSIRYTCRSRFWATTTHRSTTSP